MKPGKLNEAIRSETGYPKPEEKKKRGGKEYNTH